MPLIDETGLACRPAYRMLKLRGKTHQTETSSPLTNPVRRFSTSRQPSPPVECSAGRKNPVTNRKPSAARYSADRPVLGPVSRRTIMFVSTIAATNRGRLLCPQSRLGCRLWALECAPSALCLGAVRCVCVLRNIPLRRLCKYCVPAVR